MSPWSAGQSKTLLGFEKAGMGRIVTFKQSQTLTTLKERIVRRLSRNSPGMNKSQGKSHGPIIVIQSHSIILPVAVALPYHLRHRPEDSPDIEISTIAICAGTGNPSRGEWAEQG